MVSKRFMVRLRRAIRAFMELERPLPLPPPVPDVRYEDHASHRAEAVMFDPPPRSMTQDEVNDYDRHSGYGGGGRDSDGLDEADKAAGYRGGDR